jgi:hypothetical protein
MTADETVRIRISIDIRTEGTVDTDLTVAEWNALTDQERDQIAQENWAAMVVDNGGMWVVTDGATGI